MAADAMYLLARELLDACADAVSTAPGGPIDRSYVSLGPPPWDCCDPGQLTVHAGGSAEGPTAPMSPPLVVGQRDTMQGLVNLVQLTVTVIRCVPTLDENGNFPDPADLEAAAQVGYGDCWAIWNVLRQKHRAGTLFSSPGGKREFIFDPAAAINTMGGCGGWQIGFRVELSGYPA